MADTRADIIIDTLMRIETDRDYAPDVRRMARDHRLSVTAACRAEDSVLSDASYRNLYGNDWESEKAAAQAQARAVRAARIARAVTAAAEFLEMYR